MLIFGQKYFSAKLKFQRTKNPKNLKTLKLNLKTEITSAIDLKQQLLLQLRRIMSRQGKERGTSLFTQSFAVSAEVLIISVNFFFLGFVLYLSGMPYVQRAKLKEDGDATTAASQGKEVEDI